MLLGRSRGCTTRQFGDGAWRSEARIPPGPPFRDSAKPTLSDIVGARKQIELEEPGAQGSKDYILHIFSRGSEARICCDLPWGPLQNQLYLIELAQEHKLSYRDHCSTSISVPKSKSTVSNIVGKG